jgi:hypothetical protein
VRRCTLVEDKVIAVVHHMVMQVECAVMTLEEQDTDSMKLKVYLKQVKHT